jgi:large subunit ribosomal protein L9
MKVLFLEEVKNVARPGEIKDVADGYARNYLIPNKLAVRATQDQLKGLESRRAALERKAAKADAEARNLAETLNGIEITIKARVGEQHRLYGSVTASDIAEAVKTQTGHDVDKRKIELEEPIRRAGIHEVPIHIGKDLVPKIKVVVEGED